MRRRELKIGIFLGVVLLIAAFFIMIVGDLSLLFKKKGYPLVIYFDSVAGLEKRTLIRMAGVKVGHIEEIVLEGGRAKVTANIDFGVKISRDSKATLASLGLLGEKYVELIPGKKAEYCEPGDVIEGLAAVSFDQMGNLLQSLAEEIIHLGEALREAVGEETERASIRGVLNNLSTFTEELRVFIADNKEEFEEGVRSTSHAFQKFEKRMEEVSGNLDELILLLKETVNENREGFKLNLERIKELIEETEKSLKILNESLEKINRGEGTLGRLIHEEELYQRTQETVSELEGMIERVSSLRASFSLRAEYYGESEAVKSILSLSIWPSSKNFFLAQIVHDPWHDKFNHSLQAGILWGPLTSRAGLIESTLGAGLDYSLQEERWRISLDAFEFNRDEGPRFRLWTSFSPWRKIRFLVGIDDFTLSAGREVFFGLEIGER